MFNPRRVLQIPLGYSAGTGSAAAIAAAGRRYLWSFAGGATKSSRPEMIGAFSPIEPKFVHITDAPNFGPISKQEYLEIMHQSVFAPSAMGNVNLECYRPYEALQQGTIPILEKRVGLDYFKGLLGKHPIPTFRTWHEAAHFVIRLKGKYDDQDRLVAECTGWWAAYKLDLSARIAQFFQEPHGPEIGPAVRWQWSLPGSQAFELVRHHTAPAIARRVKLQLLRVMKEGKLRKTEGA